MSTKTERMRLVVVGVVAAVVLGGGSAKADFTFGEFTKPGPPLCSQSVYNLDCFSSDGLEIYLTSNWSDADVRDLWVVRRETTEDDWGTPMNLGHKTINEKRRVGHARESWTRGQ